MFDKLIEFLITSIKLFQFFAVLRVTEAGVVLRLGHFNRMAKVGFNWLWPFSIEELFFEHITLETLASDPQSLTTKDGVCVVISTISRYKIFDVKLFLLGVSHGRTVLDNMICGIVSRKVLDHTWTELVEMELAKELEKIIRRQAKKIGVELEETDIADFTKSKSFRFIGHHLTPTT